MATELIEQAILQKIKLGCTDRRDALVDIRRSIDSSSPYEFAKMFRVLENDSAEEFMMQFMGTYNFEVSPVY